MIPPGDQGTGTVPHSTPDEALEHILTIRDAAGVNWARIPDGELSELPGPATRESLQAAFGKTPLLSSWEDPDEPEQAPATTR